MEIKGTVTPVRWIFMLVSFSYCQERTHA